MLFRLKNAGATYQRLMNKMFAHQIRRNVQVYVGDMLVKSLHENNHLEDLRETFDTLQSYNMKLNLNKCAFGVTTGKFLGFMVSQKGIEVNPKKKFVSTATDRCLTFFRTLRKSFEWTDECQMALTT